MTQRREFLRQASLIAAGTLAAGVAEAQSSGQQPVPQGGAARPPASPLAAVSASANAQADWDMSWTTRVTGKHRMCFDAPEISDGVCLHQARSFLTGYAETLKLTDADLTAVLVIRHAAIPLVLDDALWADGAFAEKDELKDPESGKPARRNPFIRIPAGARHTSAWPDGALDTLMSRGVIVLACDLALRNVTGQIARRRDIPRQDAAELVAQHLLPGVYRMPSGIFATSHAQSLGCGVLHAS